ncbi:nascent polypeptide-associated complex subunit alpha-like protein 2 [Silene latifolia]|uniref:nascent polypeptide-associated complex subunit alpha-like protein 2 n=1 Tax=Silene latifolia TaxID=37657 RepID=UPI003D76DD23
MAQEREQITFSDLPSDLLPLKLSDFMRKDAKKDLAQGSGSEFRQSKNVEAICSDMLSFGIFPVEDVPRVTIERTGNEKVIISKPYVFKSPYSETYVILGAANNVSKEEEEVDETGINHRDIELVMVQARVSRSKAVKALKAHDSDLVSAIMELTD